MKKIAIGIILLSSVIGAAHSATKAYVTLSTGQVASFDIDLADVGVPPVTAINVGGQPWGSVANAAADKVYVTDVTLNRVLRIDTATDTVDATLLHTKILSPMGITIHPTTGDLYVANANLSATSGNVAVIDPVTFAVKSTMRFPRFFVCQRVVVMLPVFPDFAC